MTRRMLISCRILAFITLFVGVAGFAGGASAYHRCESVDESSCDFRYEEMDRELRQSRPPSIDYYYKYDRPAAHGMMLD